MLHPSKQKILWLTRIWACATASVGLLFLLFMLECRLHPSDILRTGQTISLLAPDTAGYLFATCYINAGLLFLSLIYLLARTGHAGFPAARAHAGVAVILALSLNSVLLHDIVLSGKTLPAIEQQITGTDNNCYYLIHSPAFPAISIVARHTNRKWFVVDSEIVYGDCFNTWSFRNKPIPHLDAAVRQAVETLSHLHPSPVPNE